MGRTTIALAGLLAGCGGRSSLAQPLAEPVSGASSEPSSEPSPEPSPYLTRLEEQGMLTYRVTGASGEEQREVRMQVQQRVTLGGSVAVRLVPIGTPLGDQPVYPQWLIGTPEGISALDEGAAFTIPGFVPIDDGGRLRTEAATNERWRVEARWLRAGATSGGSEAALGWSLRERVGAIDQPIAADDCVRLARSDETSGSTILVCAGLGVVERTQSAGGEVRSRWQLVRVGERPTELR